MLKKHTGSVYLLLHTLSCNGVDVEPYRLPRMTRWQPTGECQDGQYILCIHETLHSKCCICTLRSEHFTADLKVRVQQLCDIFMNTQNVLTILILPARRCKDSEN